MPRSLGARVTLVFAVGAAAALVLCLALLYLILSRQLVTALDDDLRDRSGDLVAAVAAGDVEAVVRDPLAQLYGADGAVLTGSAALGDSRLLSPDGVRRVRAEVLRTRLLERGEDRALSAVRVFSQRVDGTGVLSVAASVEPLHEARRRLLEVLVLAAPLLVAVLAIAGWLVVRAALRPVDVLTREAAAISTFEAARGLPPVPGDDEIARLARTLDAMLGRLRVAFERERAFVDDASHELRTPIAVLRGELELALSAADDPEEVERSLRAALGEAARLSRLAEDLLLLARAQAGSLIIRRELADLLDLAVTEARRLAPVLGVRIHASGEPAFVLGDPDLLRQVLANLAGNSAAAGATTVRVRVARDQEWAMLEVADDGPGFPPGVRGSAFDRFVRGDRARTRGSSGAGLGLSIVRAIVAAHDGTVEARNGDPLGGAVVTAGLPLA
ncbi:cell wall metabolism sensor histidine kinase WalK [Georgenia sp. SYP-B2076]|uniref:sensor histidine kinase n=1 Tax=Georgenia sp. SYP-B2076 TaxID=2495881 RepID=UPI000F8F7BF5|nr:ATP-binding protein [Georgenia sp. SYP-B2076]